MIGNSRVEMMSVSDRVRYLGMSFGCKSKTSVNIYVNMYIYWPIYCGNI